MSRWNALRALLCAALCSIAPPGIAAEPSPPPLQAFGMLPAQTHPVLSPDGNSLAWMDQQESRARVVIFNLVTHQTQRIMALPEGSKLRGLLYWNDNGTVLITVSQLLSDPSSRTRGMKEFSRVIAEDVAGGEGRILPTSLAEETRTRFPPFAWLVSAHTSKPHTVIMATVDPCRNVAKCLLEVDTRTGVGTVIAVGSAHTTSWVVDRSGHPVAREDWDWHQNAYRVLALEDDGVRELFRKEDSSRPNLQGLLPDGSGIVMLANNGREHEAAWTIPLNGSQPKLLIDDPDADIELAMTDRYTGVTSAVYLSGFKNATHWLDGPLAHREEVLKRAFPGRSVSMYGWTEAGDKTLVRVGGFTSPAIYYLVDFESHKADIAAEEYPALAGVQMGEVRAINYKAQDGTTIPAYLTLPASKPTGPIPLVVLPHGGPNDRDYPGFDWLAQFIASRGYAVLQPQFRGSSGFGDAFERAGYRQWGGLMQNDVTDGVHAMVEQKIADPHHVCIVGASEYGGFAALAGAAFTPDLYSCAASINGVMDLDQLMQAAVPIYHGDVSTALSFWKTHIGSPGDANLRTKSPINSIKSVHIPIMIAYGTSEVLTEQSERMVHELQAAGKTVTVVKLASEENWLSRSETRNQVLRDLEAFLREHI